MKILIDGLCLQMSGLGIRRYTNYLIESYIKRYGRENVKVVISKVTGDEFYDYILYTGSKRYIVKFFVFDGFLKTIDFDLFHSPANLNYLRKVKGKYYVTTMHDIMYKVVPYFYSNNWFVNYLKVLRSDIFTYYSLKNSDLVISISKTTQNDLLKYFHKESVIIPNGIVELSNLNNTGLGILEKIGVASKAYFLYVGSDKHHKNVDFLIRSFLKAKTNKLLIICGFKREREYEGNGRIVFTGHISDSDLAVLYKNASAFVFPSLYEGFGLPILEALQYGIKVFSSNGGALKEFPDSYVSFFDPTNEGELISLLENPNKHEIDQHALSEYLKRYDWKLLLQKLQDIVEKEYNVSCNIHKSTPEPEMALDDVLVKQYRVCSQNYKIEDDAINTGICAIYFSSNDIYNPNYKWAFETIIEKNDRYEWYKTRIIEASRHVFVRDIYKQWYIDGINETCNDLDKLYSLLKEISEDYKVVTIGSSAGGFAAILIGLKLGAYKILAFSPQFNLNYLLENCSEKYNPIIFKYKSSYRNRFYDLRNIVDLNSDSVFYIYPSRSEYDKVQASYIYNYDKLNVISIDSFLHGIPFHIFCLDKFINLNNKDLVRLAKHGNWNKTHFSLEVLGVMTFIKRFCGFYYNRALVKMKKNNYGRF